MALRLNRPAKVHTWFTPKPPLSAIAFVGARSPNATKGGDEFTMSQRAGPSNETRWATAICMTLPGQDEGSGEHGSLRACRTGRLG
jgi:hypothetical protein